MSHLPDGLRVGTSSFSSADWVGSFYPRGAKPGDFLRHYAQRLSTVEIDATWHAVPGRSTWEGWERKVPAGFCFALKAPRAITHDKALVGCEAEWERFWDLTGILGEKRGPILLQFPYVAKGKDPDEYRTGDRFRRRLAAFAEHLPAEGQMVVEVRNATWLSPPLLELLRERGIALALTAYYTMPRPGELLERLEASSDLVTAEFGYVRFLGHHRRMDQRVARAREERGKTRDWDELLVDRTEETRAWVPVLERLLAETGRVYVYYNNHYAGHAPGSIALLSRIWRER